MKQPKISLIVIYNNEYNLKECITSLINQSFYDLEIICANNSSDEKVQNIVQNIAKEDERIKLINLPLLQDKNSAQKAALNIAGGDFVCFIKSDEILEQNFIRNLYIASTASKISDLSENHLYRRLFLENDDEITHLIEDLIKYQLTKSQDIINKQQNTIKEEFNNFYKTNTETIKNSTYELSCRFNQLEKLFYDKDYQNNQKIQNFINELNDKTNNDNKKIYENIDKIYEHISSEINKKGCEINNLYEEITKNYHYTEQLISEKNSEISQNINNEQEIIHQKIQELEKEIITRYVNMKRLLDIRTEELPPNEHSVEAEKAINSGIKEIYTLIDNNSAMFYKELSKIYKELNEQLIKRSEEDRYMYETKISELKNELNTQIQQLREELTNKVCS